MPRYFFHIKQDSQIIRDDKGIVLEDLEAVKAEVIASSREMVSEFAPYNPLEDRSFLIEDNRGRLVLEFSFRDPFEVRRC